MSNAAIEVVVDAEPVVLNYLKISRLDHVLEVIAIGLPGKSWVFTAEDAVHPEQVLLHIHNLGGVNLLRVKDVINIWRGLV